ncbi:hypothetical protein Tco_0304010 [Tanacetum coccineum]
MSIKMTMDMETDIKNTLTFTKELKNKFDEMVEIVAISYLENEEFKKLVEIRNERLMNTFKPGKITAMLEFENVIKSEFNSLLDLETVMEAPENDLVANVEGNVGENLESNLRNNKEGEDRELDVGRSVNEGKNDNSKKDQGRTLSQILVNLKAIQQNDVVINHYGNENVSTIGPEDLNTKPQQRSKFKLKKREEVPISYMMPTNNRGVEQRGRVRELSESLCSPYVKRKVSISSYLQGVEKLVVDSVFSERLPPIQNVNSKAENNENGLANKNQPFRCWDICDETYGELKWKKK